MGGPSFFALLVIAVSFLPVLTLEAQEGRLFKPLAYTKTFAMIVAAVLAITLDPALRLLFTHLQQLQLPAALALPGGERGPGRDDPLRGEAPDQPRPDPHLRAGRCAGRCAGNGLVIGGGRRPGRCHRSRVHASSAPSSCRRSTKARCSTCRRRCRASRSPRRRSCCRSRTGSSSSFPEVDRVLGKAGRAETSTDPAPLSMLETVIILKPKSEWRKVDTWYSSWAPGVAEAGLPPHHAGHISTDELIEPDERRRCRFPACPTPGPCRSRPASTC